MANEGTKATRHEGTKGDARVGRRGFSFAEVMFAVIILGVGFIMIAALFPVAIRQSKSTADETSAAAFARVATNYVDTIAIDANMPVSKFGAVSGVLPSGITQVWALPTRSSPT